MSNKINKFLMSIIFIIMIISISSLLNMHSYGNPKDQALTVEAYNADINELAQRIKPRIKVVNKGDSDVKIKDIKIRYYFTKDGIDESDIKVAVNNIQVQNPYKSLHNKYNLEIHEMLEPKTGADHYLEISFTNNSGKLEKNQYIIISIDIYNKIGGLNYYQPNDYSFKSIGGNYEQWSQITAYVDDELNWGVEPTQSDQVNIIEGLVWGQEPQQASPTIKGLLKVQFYNENRSTTTNYLKTNFKIVNTGNMTLNLEDIILRYYFTLENEDEQVFECFWTGITNTSISNLTQAVIGKIYELDSSTDDATHYLEISFKPGTGKLGPLSTLEVKGGIHKANWSNYNQSNDYSFAQNHGNYQDWIKTTAYYKGTQALNKPAKPIITINPEVPTNEVAVIIKEGVEEEIENPSGGIFTITELPLGAIVVFDDREWILVNPSEGKLVLKDSATKGEWDSSKSNEYETSSIRDYLNNSFINTITPSFRNYIEEKIWSCGTENNENYKTVIDKVGLLTKNEYENLKETVFSNINIYGWLMTPLEGKGNNSAWYVQKRENLNNNVHHSAVHGADREIHPSIYLDTGLSFVEVDGIDVFNFVADDKHVDEITLKYYIDYGNEEDMQWTTYTEPFILTQNAIVKAIAVDKEGNESEVAIREISNIYLGTLSNLKYDEKYNRNGNENQAVVMQKGISEVKFNFNVNTTINNLEFILNLNSEDEFELDTVSLFMNSIKLIKNDESIDEVNNISGFDENNNLIIKLENEIQPGDYSIMIPLKVDNRKVNGMREFNLDIVGFKANGIETILEEPVRILIKVIELPKLL